MGHGGSMSEAVISLSVHLELKNKTLEELEIKFEEYLNTMCSKIEKDENYIYVSYNVNRISEI